MSPYLPSWHEGERTCPLCGHYPEQGRPIPPDLLKEGNRKIALDEEEEQGIKEHGYNPQRVIRRGCKWWQGTLPDGTKKNCFNCGWSDCVKNDQVGEGTSKNYLYMSREARVEGFTLVHPDGAPKKDCYDPAEREKHDASPSHLVYRDSALW